jgi:hypothetical protein
MITDKQSESTEASEKKKIVPKASKIEAKRQ